jgi:hypothetical protein
MMHIKEVAHCIGVKLRIAKAKLVCHDAPLGNEE